VFARHLGLRTEFDDLHPDLLDHAIARTVMAFGDRAYPIDRPPPL
jgi:hypothetical protein